MTLQEVLQDAFGHHQAGRRSEAEAGYRQYLAGNPSHASVWNNYALLAIDVRDWSAAHHRISQAIASEPGHPNFQCVLAFVLNGIGRHAEAIALCQSVLQSHPDFAPAWFGLGEAESRMGKDEEAALAYEKALQFKPDYTAAANNLGNIRISLNDLDGAVDAFDIALRLAPNLPAAHNNLGTALREMGLHREAVTCFRRALELDPSLDAARSNLILALYYIPGETPGSIRTECESWWLHCVERLADKKTAYPNAREQERALRIGYVSPDFRGHPVGRHLLPLLRTHDQSKFTVFTYSSVAVHDGVTAQFKNLPIIWRDAMSLDDSQLAEHVQSDQIDILVDLSLHTAGNRLPAFVRAPAPVQISFAGYPGSTGLKSIAYHVTDAILEPPDPPTLSIGSKPLRLPDSFWCMDAPGENIPVRALPASTIGRMTYGCLHKFAKVTDPLLLLWMQILNEVPDSTLLMLCPEGKSRDRITALAASLGVASERFRFTPFVPRADYLTLHGQIDLMLDTFPYNGHMTAMDSLWMGVPLVSLMGELPVSRGGASILSQVGLSDFVAHTPAEYVQKAVTAARDLPRLAEVRASLRERMRASPLMDTGRYTRALEGLYREAWREWCTAPRASYAL